jgi:hypothetical protein
MAQLAAEIEERGWSAAGFGQLDSDENSGSKTIHLIPGPVGPTIEVAWEKPRGAPLSVRARAGGDPVADALTVNGFFASLDARARSGQRTSLYRRSCLTYNGLPWSGELWLTDSIRLGPPSKSASGWLGQQVVVVDAIISGIGIQGVIANFETLRRELRLVLSPIIGTHFEEIRGHQDWVVEVDASGGITTCKLMNVGYVELQDAPGLPARHSLPAALLEVVSRPGLGRMGIGPGDTVQRIPDDVVTLWSAFTALQSDLKTQFLSACNAYSIAQSLWPHQRTAYAAFLVVSIEALKPKGRRYKDARVYDVVASLMDMPTALSLEQFRFAPQKVRSNHVHRGELVAEELAARLMVDSFADPSFDDMLTSLSRAARVCLITWLRKGGVYKLLSLPRPEQEPQSPGKQSKRAAKSQTKERKA